MKGLVMEGGAMRGMFTAGVCDVLLENGINFDGAIGVSAGATFGCNFKSKQIGRAIRYNKKFSHDWRYCSFRSLLLTGDLYGADFCYNELPNKLDLFDYEEYRSNPLKFYAVASDCRTGEPVYKELATCDEKDLTWMRASASMPLVSRVVKIDGYELLDGGMTDSIPLKAFEGMGYEKNLVILTQPRSFVKEQSSSIKMMKFTLRKYPKLYEAMKKRHETYNAQKKYVFEQEAAGKCLVICPFEPLGISRTEKNPDELQRVYNMGRLVCGESLAKITEFLK
ncbi:MAG: patatin family protein [Treponema sp.]|uniref:patatin-like phospholipase family protein n=1 Tax=Treponema sp. TaxID=166 RepID=UPI0025EB1B55|nr:patatin family protein [Treponema sp.]MBR0495811.1 patatin family protein [Treponema sp.]